MGLQMVAKKKSDYKSRQGDRFLCQFGQKINQNTTNRVMLSFSPFPCEI